jgi:hypothetical protein
MALNYPKWFAITISRLNLKFDNWEDERLFLFNFMLGRFAQEKAIGELKNDYNLDKIPSHSYMSKTGINN